MNQMLEPENLQAMIDGRPCVSIVIPTYNRGTLLLETLASLLAQPYRPLDVLIVDDGSTDDTPGLARQWIQEHTCDPRLRWRVLVRENRGASAARNHGLAQATGVYIHFLDSDDLVGPYFYTTLVAVMDRAPECSFASGGWLTAETATAIGELPDPHLIVPVRAQTIPHNAWCGLFRTSMLPPDLRWDETLINHNDWNFTTRFLLADPKLLLHVPVPMLIYRTHTGVERLGRIRSPDSLRAALHATDRLARLAISNNRYRRALRVRFSTEYITLLHAAMQNGTRPLQFQAALGVIRHATFRQAVFWNGIAGILLLLLPFSRSTVCAWALRRIRRWFGDTQLTVEVNERSPT